MTAGRDNQARQEPSSRLWTRRPSGEPTGSAPAGLGTSNRPIVVTAPARMTDWRAVQDFRHRCESSLQRAPKRIILDLTLVQAADTKLVACVVNAFCFAQARRIHLEVKPSPLVRDLIELCEVDALLSPSGSP